jgi:hypothetical protein
MVSVPVRDVDAVFVVAANVTVPLAEPLPPLVMVSQGALLATVHAHPLVVLTDDDADPPAAAIEWTVGETAYEHGTANENVLEGVLRPTPPGPTAATVAT